jgi:hypothetical protein
LTKLDLRRGVLAAAEKCTESGFGGFTVEADQTTYPFAQ